MNTLHRIQEFKEVLSSYKLSEDGKKLLQDTSFVLLAAPTSSGRNTIIKELLKTGRYHYVVSDTTRKPRLNDGVMEQNGLEYWFRTEDEVLDDLKSGTFLEAAIVHEQQVSGVSLRELQKAYDDKKTAITDIEMHGVESIMRVKPDVIVLFVIPPNFSEWQRRLQHRGDMNPAEVVRRMESAVMEFRHALENNYYEVVINDTVPHAVEQIEAIVQDPAKYDNELGRQTIEQLLAETTSWLTKQISR